MVTCFDSFEPALLHVVDTTADETTQDFSGSTEAGKHGAATEEQILEAARLKTKVRHRTLLPAVLERPAANATDVHARDLAGDGVESRRVNIVVLVELPHADGVRLVGNLLGDAQQSVDIGQPVRAVFEHHDDAEPSYTLLQWTGA
jgi:hypothetical protein